MQKRMIYFGLNPSSRSVLFIQNVTGEFWTILDWDIGFWLQRIWDLVIMCPQFVLLSRMQSFDFHEIQSQNRHKHRVVDWHSTQQEDWSFEIYISDVKVKLPKTAIRTKMKRTNFILKPTMASLIFLLTPNIIMSQQQLDQILIS